MAKTKKMSRRKYVNLFIKICLIIVAIILCAVLALVGLIAGSLYGYVESTELVDIENMRLNLTSFVYAVDPESGEMVEIEKLYDTENRVWVSGDKIPQYLKHAFVSIEDERFYKHKGFDIKRLVGAATQYITNNGNSSYGGSTITQQLIKNLTQDDSYSVKRKIQEVYRAYSLEKELSKSEILEYYLNTIYLSQKCNGVASAAQTYFGKDVSELSLAECASIAGITKYPTKYDPLIHPENNKERQLIILKKMYELGYITSEEYNEAKQEELVFVKPVKEEKKRVQSYFTDAAIEQVLDDLMEEYNYTREYASKILYNGGLKIYLSMDMNIQNILDNVYNDENTFLKVSGEVQPQSAMVIMDPYSGLVKALIGGRGEKEGNLTLNRATQSRRQPGSSIKPLAVYSPAIEYGLVNPSSIINDAEVKYGSWKPRNDDRRFLGRITVRAALRGSRNVPAVKICDYLTADASFDFVKNHYHISGLVDEETRNGKTFTDKGLAQIALGGLTDGVTVLDMCAAYCVFPNGGKYIRPSLYTQVLDSEGKVVLEHKKKTQIAISETTAKDMISMLTDAVNSGTGTSARLSNMRVAGKTGTTSNNHDRWFAGFTPHYVGVVWFGFDKPAPLRGFSKNPAAVAWNKVMSQVHEGLENKEFLSDSDGKMTMMLCAESGMRATPACLKLKSEDFDKNSVPTKFCTEHKYNFGKNALLDGKTNKVVEKHEEIEAIPQEELTGEEGGGSMIEMTPSDISGETLPSEEPENSLSPMLPSDTDSPATTDTPSSVVPPTVTEPPSIIENESTDSILIE